jgi:hypothetical protein
MAEAPTVPTAGEDRMKREILKTVDRAYRYENGEWYAARLFVEAHGDRAMFYFSQQVPKQSARAEFYTGKLLAVGYRNPRKTAWFKADEPSIAEAAMIATEAFANLVLGWRGNAAAEDSAVELSKEIERISASVSALLSDD